MELRHAGLARGAPRGIGLDEPDRLADEPSLPQPLAQRRHVARALVHVRVPLELARLPARLKVAAAVAAGRVRHLVEGRSLVGRAEHLEGRHNLLKGDVRKLRVLSVVLVRVEHQREPLVRLLGHRHDEASIRQSGSVAM